MGIIFLFWLIYLLIGLIFALKQKRLHNSLRKQINKSRKGNIIDSSIYDYDYYLHAYSGNEKQYVSNLNALPMSLVKCFSYADSKPGENILDIGCGRGALAYHCVMNGCIVTAIDYSQTAIELANKTRDALPENLRDKMAVKRMDFKELDTAEKYDVIFMADLVEHLYDWQLKELFKKARQILKKDTGRIVIHTTPNKVWINIIRPLKRILGWPKTLRKKRDFFYRRDKYSYDPLMHVNEQTPGSLRRLLKGFKAKIWCDDGSSNLISLLTRSCAGADIWAIAKLK